MLEALGYDIPCSMQMVIEVAEAGVASACWLSVPVTFGLTGGVCAFGTLTQYGDIIATGMECLQEYGG